MYIYADESGHTGRSIFDEPEFYLQGAIFSHEDLEKLFHPLMSYYYNTLGIHRVHTNEILPHIVSQIANDCLDLLGDHRQWAFHATIIQKPYLSTTKFVDMAFDSGENIGVRWLWYNHEFFRHTLCCLFDDVLTERNKRYFWQCFCTDDYNGMQNVIRNALTYLDRYAKDRRLNEVARDGLSFALHYPEEITLMASKSKKSYKGHTPNMVAFSCLIQAVHDYCLEFGCTPKVFIHDQQSEFAPTMREYAVFSGRSATQKTMVDYRVSRNTLTIISKNSLSPHPRIPALFRQWMCYSGFCSVSPHP